MLTTIVFDVDGTLLNSIEDIKDSLNIALTKLNFEPCTTEQVKRYVGSGVKVLVHRALRPFEHTDSDEGNVLQIYNSEYEEHKKNKTNTFFGITEVLYGLRKMGIKLAVLSNKKHEDVIDLIHHFFGTDCFDMILGKQHGIPVKPDPASLVEIMHTLHCHAEEVMVVGDGETDMELANNLGVKKCAVTWGYRSFEELESHSPDYMINEPHELLDIAQVLHEDVNEDDIIENDFDDARQASNVQIED